MGGGVAKFDGRNFTNFTTKNNLPNNFVHSLFEYQDTLWVGTQKGLCFYDGNTFTQVQDSSIAGQHIVSIYKDSARTLVGTASGIYEQIGIGGFTHISNLFGVPKLYVATLYRTRSGVYWIGGSKGVLRYAPNEAQPYTRYTTSDGLATNDVECFVELADSSLLIGTYGAGVYQLKDTKITPFRVTKNIGREIIHDFLLDEKLWIGTQRNGLIVVDLETRDATVISQKDGLANNHVRTLLKDDWGTYWIGTSGGGVSKYFGQSFVHYTTKKGLPGNYIYSLHEDRRKQLWMGVSDKGVVRKDSAGFTHFGKDSGFLDQKIKAIAEDDFGRLWLGTSGDGIYIYNGKTFDQLPRKNGLKGRFIKDLAFDGKRMWSATIDGGLFSINIGKGKSKELARQYGIEQGVQSNRINALCLYDGKMWYGCQSKGVGYVSRGEVTDLNATAAFPSWSVRAMRADTLGNLWIASGGAGLIRIYKTKEASGYLYEVYGYDNGLLSTNIYSIQVAGNKVYCGSENGIDELTLNNDFDVIETQHYGYDEGFIGVETCQNAAMQDTDGNLWFGTINGLSQYKPNEQAENTLVPNLSFTEIKANLTPWQWTGNEAKAQFKHFENTFSFDFVGVDLRHPKRVNYAYRLDGEDGDWSKPSTGNSVRYANLAAGNYAFRLKATSDGIHWSAEKVFRFHIATAFWKTWWFWLLVVLGLGLFVFSIFRYRINRLKQKAEEENLKYQMKNELLQLEQKALRLQMNPHFLFNALNSIQGLIIKNDQKSARYYLAKFAHLMRQILDNSRSGSISLEEEIKSLENYLLIEKLSKKDTFEYSINVADDINTSTTQLPPMLIQPFVENAIIHAFTGREGSGEIGIALTRKDDMLHVSITDNGIGRAKAGEISKLGVNRRSVGIEVTEQRLIAHNEQYEGQSIKIIDVVNEDMEATGTRVELKIRVE